MKNWIKNWGIPGLIVAVLLMAGVLHIITSRAPVPEGTLKEPLAEKIPEQFSGWEVEDLDLGPTESVIQRSERLLQLDDFVHRSYRRGGEGFTVYIAYWKPGKMPVRLVNQHTPDRCWTEVGWACTDREWNVERTVKGRPLQPGQWGVYEFDDHKNYTYFWHIVGGEAHWYGGERINTRTSLSTIWEDFTNFGLNVYREQFFVRIVSSEPMDELWEEPVFLEVMDDLADLCLAEPKAEVAMK